MKALLFAGAFNPPTIAHIEQSHFAMERSGRDEVIFVPSKSFYIEKEQRKDYAFSEEERLRMLKKIASSRPWMKVSDFEIRQKEQPRTYLTLKHFQEMGLHVSLLFGSDKLPELETGWLHVDEIGKEFGFVVMQREGESVESILESTPYLRARKDYFTIVGGIPSYEGVSSSLVRERMKERKDVSRLVCPEILPMLEENR